MMLETPLYTWSLLFTRGASIKCFFSDNRIRSIAIYGCGKLGELMYPEAKKYGVDVKFAIDRSKDWFYDLPVIRPEQLADMSGSVDCIVVCISSSLGIEFEIDRFLDRVPIPSIYLDEILTACFYKELMLPLCEKKGLHPYILSMPLYKSLNNLDYSEKIIATLKHEQIAGKTPPHYFDELYADITEYSPAYINHVCSVPTSVPYKGAMMLPDMRTRYVNIIGGMRANPFLLDDFNKTIHILGHCAAYGFGVDDRRTIAARLQQKLNEENTSAGIRVLNHGQVGMNVNSNPTFILNAINGLNCKERDILITIADTVVDNHRTGGLIEGMLNRQQGNVYHCLREYFNEKRKKIAYMTAGHLSPHGMELTADYIHQVLLRDNMMSDERTAFYTNAEHSYSEEIPVKAIGGGYCSSEDAEEPHPDIAFTRNVPGDGLVLADYLRELRELRAPFGQSAGAVVMNCNPFTKGHKHLIERAAKEVDTLYIFVVQEDKSEFPFETRMDMVKAGVSDIENAICLPSGKYVLSTITFPEYFSKDTNRDAAVDCSTDITIFADKIAPCLGITKRFVGKEPFDLVTRQYNSAMKDILPAYGIEVVEYERFAIGGATVSASTVRKMLATGRPEEVRSLVPDTTYNLIACPSDI
jgi:[citrate (pro-3S)-lyase] ligase